jgi:hypothetical protein
MNRRQPPDAGILWRKSSYSNVGNQCVEVARTSARFLVRDSRSPEGLWLVVSRAERDALISDVKRGTFVS